MLRTPHLARTFSLRLSILAASLLLFSITSCVYDSVSEPEQHLTPNFTMKTLDGELFTLSEQHGKVVMLQFFASW